MDSDSGGREAYMPVRGIVLRPSRAAKLREVRLGQWLAVRVDRVEAEGSAQSPRIGGVGKPRHAPDLTQCTGGDPSVLCSVLRQTPSGQASSHAHRTLSLPTLRQHAFYTPVFPPLLADLVATADRKGLSARDVVAVLTKMLQEQQWTIELDPATEKMIKDAFGKMPVFTGSSRRSRSSLTT